MTVSPQTYIQHSTFRKFSPLGTRFRVFHWSISDAATVKSYVTNTLFALITFLALQISVSLSNFGPGFEQRLIQILSLWFPTMFSGGAAMLLANKMNSLRVIDSNIRLTEVRRDCILSIMLRTTIAILGLLALILSFGICKILEVPQYSTCILCILILPVFLILIYEMSVDVVGKFMDR